MPNNTDPQVDPLKPVPDSSTVTDADPKNPKSPDPKTKTDTPTDDDIAAIRHDASYRSRRLMVKSLRDNGHDVTVKTLDEYLKGLKPGAPKPTKTDKPKDKSELTDAESETEKLLRKEVEDLKRGNADQSAAFRASVIESAIIRATAGIAFANEKAADDAVTAFERAYSFELADDNRTVRVLDTSGEPMMNKYKPMTLREAFNQFLDERPHFKKTERKTEGQDLKHQRGTTQTSESIDDFFRKAAGAL